ncbi:hypothetical protein VTK73DRAFT_2353 [Phialemonium thermophilum]|uniref:Uncharacterized protein n=1 Tax=Phialemonium thermophilum TaxID=223376 RepID=A0ABR3VS84_9PEZI
MVVHRHGRRGGEDGLQPPSSRATFQSVDTVRDLPQSRIPVARGSRAALHRPTLVQVREWSRPMSRPSSGERGTPEPRNGIRQKERSRSPARRRLLPNRALCQTSASEGWLDSAPSPCIDQGDSYLPVWASTRGVLLKRACRHGRTVDLSGRTQSEGRAGSQSKTRVGWSYRPARGKSSVKAG